MKLLIKLSGPIYAWPQWTSKWIGRMCVTLRTRLWSAVGLLTGPVLSDKPFDSALFYVLWYVSHLKNYWLIGCCSFLTWYLPVQLSHVSRITVWLRAAVFLHSIFPVKIFHFSRITVWLRAAVFLHSIFPVKMFHFSRITVWLRAAVFLHSIFPVKIFHFSRITVWLRAAVFLHSIFLVELSHASIIPGLLRAAVLLHSVYVFYCATPQTLLVDWLCAVVILRPLCYTCDMFLCVLMLFFGVS
jgi:hypothetical protein